jgi:hypothetical protein
MTTSVGQKGVTSFGSSRLGDLNGDIGWAVYWFCR